MNNQIKLFATIFLLLFPYLCASAQSSETGDTIVVQTLTLDSIGRAGYYQFPDTGSFEKVLMEYTMRCHHALVSNDVETEQGCGQWDYNCESYIWDSTRTDSLQNVAPSAIISNYPQYVKFPFTTKGTSSITRLDEKLVAYPTGTKLSEDTAQYTIDGSDIDQGTYLRAISTMPKINQPLSQAIKTLPIVGIVMNINGTDTLHDLRIRLHPNSSHTYSGVNIFTDTSFVEVYHATTILKTGMDTLLFYKPFTWNGLANLVFDISYAGIGGTLATMTTTSNPAWTSAVNAEYALSFAGSEFIPVPTSALNNISNAISIAFWAYGDTSYLPGSNSVFCEGLGAQNNREINIHLPWSDGNVYWDCGGDSLGNYDRIQKAATKLNAAGRWNHWVFTKDAVSGIMSIYLNGSLWMTDTGMHRTINATEMLFGGAASSGIGWYGNARQFAIFNKVLDSAQIFSIMYDDANIQKLQQQDSSSLVTYFKLNEGSGSTITNSAVKEPSSTLRGVPVWRIVEGKDLHNNFDEDMFPSIGLIQLMDTTKKAQITDRYTYDTLPDNAHIVTNYAIGHNYALHANDSVRAIDTIYGDYLATKSYTFDESGNKVDSVNVAAQDTVRPDSLFYFTRGPQKFELMSFVTPYGIDLDLGKTGKTWEFDVTDYLPIMKGWHRLTMERGSGQEEFDLKFLFIKGTPTRNVIDMQQIWPMTEETYTTIQSNLRYQPLSVYLEPSAKAYKLRSYITGHGQQGEFIPQTHYISVNDSMYQRLVYKICSLDPLYPQGGTWTYDRSGWCPGMATDLAEYEITGTVTPGDSVRIDYGVEGGSGDSRYDPGTQLVSYGPPNFTLDAAIVNIQRPSPLIAYGRINPACDQPIVFIRNNGSTTLTSLQFEYYVDNGPHLTYTWNGSLPFLDTASVILPVDSLGFWTSADSGGFHVDISKPNGGTDQYDQNNHYSSSYTQPPAYNGIIVVNLYTNNDPGDNYYEVLDKYGDTVFSNGGFDATTSYYDSLIFPVGCYTLVFHDDGEDGLSYWANPAQGTGYLRLRQTSKTGKILETFNPDFGMGVQYDFSIVQSPLAVGVTQPVVEHFGLYPNPSSGQLNLDLEGMPPGMITLEVIDATGRTVKREQRFTDPLGTLRAGMDITGVPAGAYILRLETKDGQTTQNFVIE